MNILVLNAGASSFKSSSYRLNGELSIPDLAVPFWTGQIDWNSSKIAVLKIQKLDNSTDPASTTASVRAERSGTTRFRKSDRIPIP